MGSHGRPLKAHELPALVALLSTPELLPASLHMRNMLLIPFTASSFFARKVNHDVARFIIGSGQERDGFSWPGKSKQGGTDKGVDAPLPPQWQIFEGGYVTRYSIRICGDAPHSFTSAAVQSISGGEYTSAEASHPVWAIVLAMHVIQPSLPVSDPRRHRLRGHVFFSTGPHLSSPGFKGTREWAETCHIFSNAVEQWLGPLAMEPVDGGEGPEDKPRTLHFSALDGNLAQSLREEGEGKRWNVLYDNPCGTFVTRVDVGPGGRKVDLPALDTERWEVGDVGDGVDEIVNANKIPFPRGYIATRAAVSSAIRDRQNGCKPVAWCVTHEDLSIAALHTLPAYRRMSGVSLGRQIVLSVMPKIASVLASSFCELVSLINEIGSIPLDDAVRTILRMNAGNLPADAGDDAASAIATQLVHANSENDNQPAWRLFERCGWEWVSEDVWMSLRFDDQLRHHE